MPLVCFMQALTDSDVVVFKTYKQHLCLFLFFQEMQMLIIYVHAF